MSARPPELTRRSNVMVRTRSKRTCCNTHTTPPPPPPLHTHKRVLRTSSGARALPHRTFAPAPVLPVPALATEKSAGPSVMRSPSMQSPTRSRRRARGIPCRACARPTCSAARTAHRKPPEDFRMAAPVVLPGSGMHERGRAHRQYKKGCIVRTLRTRHSKRPPLDEKKKRFCLEMQVRIQAKLGTLPADGAGLVRQGVRRLVRQVFF